MKKTLTLISAILFSLAVFAQSDSLHYRAVLSFGSIGTGVPDNKAILNYVSSFKKKNKIKKIAYDRIGPMGREGEYYMAFPLKELSKKQRTAFIKGIKSAAAKATDRGHINVEEDASYSKEDFSQKLTHLAL